MDSCKDHFLIPFFRKCTDLLQHTFNIPASDTASCIGNDTVRTELIASVLNLDICPYMFCCMINGKFLILFCLIDLDHMGTMARFVFRIFGQCLHNIDLLVISQNKINGFVFFQFLATGLYITARCHHDRFRIHFFGFVEHLS